MTSNGVKVLMISGDTRMLDSSEEAGKRLALQKAQVDALDFFVWPREHRAREILHEAKTKQYDVVTAQDPFWRGLLARRAARLSGATLNIQVHVDLSGQSFFRRMLARRVLKSADSVRVVSEHVRKQLEPWKLKAKISVLPVFVDLERYRTLLHRKHPRFFRTILWIGRFEHEKNPLFAFKTLMKAREEGIDACLIMLGEGRLKRSLMQAARRYKKCVEFPGWKDPAPYLAMADVVISTSEHESYGASIVEALAAGVPVVSLDVGVARAAGALVTTLDDLPEVAVSVLQSGKRATLLLPTLDAEAWAKKWRETLL